MYVFILGILFLSLYLGILKRVFGVRYAVYVLASSMGEAFLLSSAAAPAALGGGVWPTGIPAFLVSPGRVLYSPLRISAAAPAACTRASV